MAANVILLHGLARTDKSMGKIENALSRQGYCVTNVSYDSRVGDIETLASKAIVPALIDCPSADSVHFVTHSLGGILLRQYLLNHSIENLGRVVMLGPPNQGSEVVDELRDFPGFGFINGEAGQELGTGANSVPRRLGPANFDLGVIAGTSSVNPILSEMIPGQDDGKVSIESTRLEGMSDHIVMDVSHTFMMRDDEVIEQVISFLQSGKFRRAD
jgi:pimeloyl-ACP methyl ester carboxylesterase